MNFNNNSSALIFCLFFFIVPRYGISQYETGKYNPRPFNTLTPQMDNQIDVNVYHHGNNWNSIIESANRSLDRDQERLIELAKLRMQNEWKQKEYELKQRELELRQREIELKQGEYGLDKESKSANDRFTRSITYKDTESAHGNREYDVLTFDENMFYTKWSDSEYQIFDPQLKNLGKLQKSGGLWRIYDARGDFQGELKRLIYLEGAMELYDKNGYLIEIVYTEKLNLSEGSLYYSF